MIRMLVSALRSPQIFLPLVLFALAGLMISMAWDIYADQTERSLPSANIEPQSKDASSVQEIRSMLAGSPVDEDENLDLIAQNNLFTADREAWHPPQKKENTKESGQDKNDNERRSARRIQQISRSKIRLYGTTITNSDRTALIYMEPFESKHKYYLAHEGEILRDEGERGEWLYFKVTAIGKNAVSFEDPAGDSFEIGLFDHQREKRKTASRDTSGIQITVGGEEIEKAAVDGQEKKRAEEKQSSEKSLDSPDKTDDGSQAQDSGASRSQANEGTEDAAEDSQGSKQQESEKGPQSLIEAFRKRLSGGGGEKETDSKSQEEGEQEVQEGKRRKIETPFGTIYRPAN